MTTLRSFFITTPANPNLRSSGPFASFDRMAFWFSLAIGVGVTCLPACSQSTLKLPGASASTSPPVSPLFREQVMTLVRQGATLQAATDQGITAQDFKKSLIEVKAAYDIALGTWPGNGQPDAAKKAFADAIAAWDLARYCIESDGGKLYEDRPLWSEIATATGGGDGVEVAVEKFDEKNMGKRYIRAGKPLAGRFFGVASGHFQFGKDVVLKMLSEAK